MSRFGTAKTEIRCSSGDVVLVKDDVDVVVAALDVAQHEKALVRFVDVRTDVTCHVNPIQVVVVQQAIDPVSAPPAWPDSI